MPELGAAEGVDGGVNEGVAHHQHHVQLEQGSVTLAVRVHGAHHDDDEVEIKGHPAHNKCSEQNGERQSSPHIAAPPLLEPRLSDVGKSCDALGVDASQHEHVDVEEADDHQGDDEEDNEADHNKLEVKKRHHQHGQHSTCGPDGA